MALPVNLDQTYLAVIDEAREVARSVESWAMEADESSVVHQATVDALRASRLAELMVPSSHGGRFESVDPLAVCLAREALMKTSSHLDSLFALQGIGSYAISLAGTEEQRREWLPRVATCEVLAALALTEPVAGSDLKGVTTTVEVRDGDLVLNGQKSFISNAGSAGFYTTLAREGDGYSLVLVPADAQGLTVSASPEIIAPHVLGELTFNDVVLPASARLGEPGQAFQTCARNALGVSDLGGRRGSRSHGRRAGGSRSPHPSAGAVRKTTRETRPGCDPSRRFVVRSRGGEVFDVPNCGHGGEGPVRNARSLITCEAQCDRGRITSG